MCEALSNLQRLHTHIPDCNDIRNLTALQQLTTITTDYFHVNADAVQTTNTAIKHATTSNVQQWAEPFPPATKAYLSPT